MRIKLWISAAVVFFAFTACQNMKKDYTEKTLGYDMVFVKGGTFTMGCTSEQGNDCRDDEMPAHEVTLDNFHIGRYEVTQAQWRAIMVGSYPSMYKGDSLPVHGVSWKDVNEFIKRLNEKTGKNYRLPTQAEWEYAARGGSKSMGYKYSGSNDVDEVAWHYGSNWDNSTVMDEKDRMLRILNELRPHPVGQKKPNELGIYDMSGNIGEWCSDFAGPYDSHPKVNPVIQGRYEYPVYRGGYYGGSNNLRVSDRGGNSGKFYDGNDVGFRLVHSGKPN